MEFRSLYKLDEYLCHKAHAVIPEMTATLYDTTTIVAIIWRGGSHIFFTLRLLNSESEGGCFKLENEEECAICYEEYFGM